MSGINKKNVVIIRTTSIYNDSRTIKEAKVLKEAGYNVIIIGWDRDGYAKTKNEKDNDFCNEIIFYDFPSVYGSGIKNMVKLLGFWKWLYTTLKRIKNIDIIHACDFDTAYVAYSFSKNKEIKLVYDIFDYYIDCHNIPKMLKKLIEKIDINIINKSDLVIICTEERREQIKKASPYNCIVVHNSPKLPEFHNYESVCKSKSGKTKICYVGILQDDRLLKEIGEDIRNHKEIELHIGGFGKYEEYFKSLSIDNENVFFYGRLDYNKVLKLESECDILFATYNPSIPNHRYSAPNKVYEAMSLGLPVIVCKNTGLDKIVLDNSIGIMIEYNAEEFFKGINLLKNYDKKVIDIYSWKVMESRLLDGYKSLYK